jgi:hypothetical protein
LQLHADIVPAWSRRPELLSGEVTREPSVPVTENGGNDAPQEAADKRATPSESTRLKLESIEDFGSRSSGRDDSFVLPPRHAQHRGRLEEASSGLSLRQHQIVEIERKDPEQQQPASPEWFSHGDVVQGVAAERTRGRHS